MIPDLQRMDWMPSPPLAPIDSPLDLDHLSRMTLGDAELEQEVLAMFAEQAVRLIAAMTALPAEAGPLADKLKGWARGRGGRPPPAWKPRSGSATTSPTPSPR